MATETSAKTLESLTAALDKALIAKALPGELDGFDKVQRREAARFAAAAALTRKPGTATVSLDALPESLDHRRRLRLAIVNDDMPFLVDSIAGTVASEGIAIDRIIHPVVHVTRDAAGRFQAIGAKGAAESLIYIEMERVDARARRQLVSEIERTLRQVRSAVADWPRLQEAMRVDAERLEGEGRALLHWFLDRNFTLLSHDSWSVDGTTSKPLGLARHTGGDPILADASRALAVKWFEKRGDAPLLLKSNRISSVHRRAQLDLIIVPVREGKKVTGLSIHAGLWTSGALNAPPAEIPLLRQRLTDLEAKLGFDPTGHAGKALTHALVALPHDQVIGFTPDALEEVTLAAMSLADRPRPKLVTIMSPLGRHLFCFVWLPRDEVTTARRVAIGDMLADAANAKLLSWSIALEDGVVALIRYTLDLREGGKAPDTPTLDAQLERMVRGWSPAVEAALDASVGAARAARMTLRWANEFPQGYRYANSAEEAARDVVRLDGLADEDARNVRIFSTPSDGAETLCLKIYRRGGALPLSDAVPVLENFGFRVIEERPTRLATAGMGFIHEFLLQIEGGAPHLGSPEAIEVLEDAIACVLMGAAENDSLNKLILAANLKPRAVLLFRAWFRYLRQTGMAYGMATVVEALRRAPKLATALVQRFDAAHDPVARKGSEAAIANAEKAIDAGLDKVSAIDDDRIIRAIRGVIDATLRTNAFAPAASEALAFKMDSAKVPNLPAPLPWREIFVYSPRVEGIHLRAGPVARGGLRWSDRRDDFRTEVLGLMKAQRVKNAVIVPTGAKGGFYPKQLPAPGNRDAWLAEGTESYRIFIRSLLSITDNIVDGKVVHPDAVVIHDGDDPYFVVAADKGTATFSDVANAIAMERGFWLGDAFASGGSQGYDHKAMGITAKGGWISVQRHFAERGIDVQSDPINVVGCGDMSGDVFGNGMLLSKAIKLKAAFDHRHIFLDPDPDPAASWAERDRMFNLPRSSWADYEDKLISKGGGVFARSEKSIPLSRQVRDMLGVEDAKMEPGALISAILKAPVDLIWFGGIGTYVKAASESHLDVGDPANDRLRVNAEEVRAVAIGEGANLGVTQAGRIAYALRGGRINTDFIDNSAGVDCSDNEVNIKIALNREMIEGRLSQKDRDALLVKMTDDVAHLVLEDNRLQTLALSAMENDGAPVLPSYVRLIEIFEGSGRLDRAVEGLAANEELLRRAQDGQGLTRPELAVLLATGKLALQEAIEQSTLDTDPSTRGDLHAAFPSAMRKRFEKAIDQHRLRNEIIATKLANRMINRLGVLNPFELAEEEGAAISDIAAMYVAAEKLFGLPDLFKAIEDAPITEAARVLLLDEAAYGVRVQIADLLRAFKPGTSPTEIIAALEKGIARLDKEADALLATETKTQAGRIADELAGKGAPHALVKRVVKLFELDGAVGLADLAQRLKLDEVVLTKAFIGLGSALGLDWAQSNAARITPSDPWERLLIAGLARDFQQLRLDFLGRTKTDPQGLVDSWLAANAQRVVQFRSLVDRARRASTPNAAMLAQIASQARVLLGR
jgi:glutamate dehydrogenase